MKRAYMMRLAAALAGLVLGAGAVVAAATPAQAVPEPVDPWAWCTGTAKVCFATDRNGGGTHWQSTLLPVGTCVGVPASMNDKISSLWNKYQSSGGLLTIYWNNPCGSPQFTYGPHTQVNYVGNIHNDQISAVCLGPRRVEGQTTGCP
jgi:hypothetical protein